MLVVMLLPPRPHRRLLLLPMLQPVWQVVRWQPPQVHLKLQPPCDVCCSASVKPGWCFRQCQHPPVLALLHSLLLLDPMALASCCLHQLGLLQLPCMLCVLLLCVLLLLLLLSLPCQHMLQPLPHLPCLLFLLCLPHLPCLLRSPAVGAVPAW